MTDDKLKQLKTRVYELYGRQHLYDPRNIFIDTQPKTRRHEDKIPGWSGTWVDISVFVPDDDEEGQ